MVKWTYKKQAPGDDMKRDTLLRLCISVLALSVSGSALPGTLPASQSLSQASERDVIVIMRDQLPSVPPMRRAMGARAATIAAAQGPVINQLQQMRAHKIHSFGMINAFATRMSAAEEAQIAQHPMVLAVVPDSVIRAPQKPNAAAVSIRTAAKKSTTGGEVVSSGLCNTLEPEALQLTNAAFPRYLQFPQAQQVRDGNGKTVTGKGVKVAFIADGLDTTDRRFHSA